MSWLLPNHFSPWTTVHHELLAAIALATALWAMVLLNSTKYKLPLSSLIILMLSSLPFLQFFSGLVFYAGDAWLASLYLASLSASIFVGFNLQRMNQSTLSLQFSSGLAWVFLLSSLVSCFIALYQWMNLGFSPFVYPAKIGSRPSANMAQPNNLATLLSIGIAALIYLFEQYKLNRLFSVVVASILFFGVALTQSRTPWLMIFFALTFWAWQRHRLVLRLNNLHLALWASVYIAMLFLLPALAEMLGLSSSSPIERVQQVSRWSMYNQFIHAILQGPWYGYGWNQVFTAQAAIGFEQLHYEPATYTHNILLDLLIWNGPVLGGGIILCTAIWLWQLLRQAKSLTATFVWLALGFLIIHSMLEFPHAYLFFLIPSGLLLGVLQESSDTSKSLIDLSRLATMAMAFCSTLFIIIIWNDYQLIEKEYHATATETHNLLISKDNQEISKIYLLSNMREYIYFIRLPINSEYSDDQLKDLYVITQRYPYFYVLLKSAYILAINDRIDDAQQKLMTIPGLHTPKKLDQALTYLLAQSSKQPKLLPLLKRFNIQPESTSHAQ